MILPDDPKLPPEPGRLQVRLTDLLRQLLQQVNALTKRSDTPTDAAAIVTVTASPFTFTAERGGLVAVVGTASVFYGRQGAFTAVPGGLVPVKAGDSVRVTYTIAPTVTFIPQ